MFITNGDIVRELPDTEEWQKRWNKEIDHEVWSLCDSDGNVDSGSGGLSSLTVRELKSQCEELRLETTGKKADLIERIESHLAGDIPEDLVE